MAERSVRRRKKKENFEPEKPTKEETAVAKHLRFNLPTKTTSIEGHKVEYFTGSKAVDFLQDSKWATGKGNTEVLFTDRESVVSYLDKLLWKGLFYRALKVVKKSKKEGKEKEGKSKEETSTKKEKKAKKGKEKEKEKEKKKTDADPSEKGDEDKEKEKEEFKGEVAESKDGGKEETPTGKKKEGKKKIRLELTDDQKFVDGNDAFVWVYDPIRPMYYVYGLGLVIGAIAVCLFPLWPPWMRVGTYYLSLAGAGFVGAILALAVVRLILFILVWGATAGKIHFWLFPNLLADVGIKESFMPLYSCDVMTAKTSDEKKEKTKDGEEEKGEENGEETTPDDQPNQELSTDSKEISGVENIPENIGREDIGLTDEQAEKTEDSVDVTEDDNYEDEEEEEEEDGDEETGNDDFEMIDEQEISEAYDESGSSQQEEEE